MMAKLMTPDEDAWLDESTPPISQRCSWIFARLAAGEGQQICFDW